MKFTIVLALVGAVAVSAQSQPPFTETTPECVKTCATSMWQLIKTQFLCPDGDVACACRNDHNATNSQGVREDFGSGFWDCSRRSCTNLDDANAGAQYGRDACSSAGVTTVVIQSVVSLLPDATAAAGSPITSDVLYTVTLSGGAVTVSTSKTTIYSNAPAGPVTDGTPAGPAATNTLVTSVSPTTVAPTTGPTDSANTATDGSTTGTSSSSGLGSQATAVPMAGLLAAAGLVAALL
ncbi:hypothetical protein B0T16DRAFT_386908 [Cercophora newfieldiana]|uniref:CFEM domain-containing protein n=1 Tax=Cercophora newfieldiana TaxID=92897 RepID=A0AA40CTZ9_9PEZI|nr:hypothetical protein B0T16DRAFT_386908 [Cercophora newfieldiana]